MIEFLISKSDRKLIVLRDFKEFIFKFLSIEEDKEMINILLEIVKNVHDHSEGCILRASRVDNELCFSVNQISIDCNPLRNSDDNFGIGLKIIEDLAESIKDRLKIFKNDVWNYVGIYKLKENYTEG